MIPLKKPEMQGAKFSGNETYLSYVAVSGKLKQRRRLDFFRGIAGRNLSLFLVRYKVKAFFLRDKHDSLNKVVTGQSKVPLGV